MTRRAVRSKISDRSTIQFSGNRAYQLHDMTIAADGTIYAGENDVPYRSGYLWEITLTSGNGTDA